MESMEEYVDHVTETISARAVPQIVNGSSLEAHEYLRRHSPGSQLDGHDAPTVHPTAIVHPNAELGRHVRVGPYSIVGPGTATAVHYNLERLATA